MNESFLKSPLNYTGGKYKLLPQILPLFPKDVNTFVDLFCGGGNIGINAECNKVLFNDSAECVIKLFESWKESPSQSIVKSITKLIRKFKLSETSKYGYEFYGCTSSSGLADYNREPYAELKWELNKRRKHKAYTTYLFVAIVYAFNNQIRFNSKGEFNLPVGKRDFNNIELKKLLDFVEKLHLIDCEFSSIDFRNFDYSRLTEHDFVYVDPPYLITTASYNEKKCWTPDEEGALLEILDGLTQKGIRFALSNVLEAKGQKNDILISWVQSRPNYICHHLKSSYRNSNYHRKEKDSFTDEVLVTNY